MDKLDAMNAFVKVVALGSYAEAGRALGLTRSAVSKAVMELEQLLGARLLDRTTRRVGPTEAGLAYYERCLDIIGRVEETEMEVSRLHTEPKGVLRVNAPMSFGALYLGPAAADFMQDYPDLKIELTLNDRFIDPIEEGVDVTIRIASLADSSLIARKLAPARRVLAAA
ncbi:MAG TPA: LysR family transcriptional regulator, partial [Geobacterales bacterium]|nr:LysR family transcriptional regulator [Geobacterales bacterium]